jgi:hypothetical protein
VCTALGEAWLEMRHKLTLNCVSPEDRRGRTWDLIEEELCPHIISFVEISSFDTLNISSDATLIVTTDTYCALETLIIVVIFVCVVCFVVIPRAYYMPQRKKLRRRSEVPQTIKCSFLSPRKVPRYECLHSSPLVVLTQQDTCRKQSIRPAQCDVKLIDGYGYLL